MVVVTIDNFIYCGMNIHNVCMEIWTSVRIIVAWYDLSV